MHKVVHGTTEAQTNLKIALKVQSLLEQSGAIVILTRSDDEAIYSLDSKTLKQKKISDIHNRVKIGNEAQADIFVSIHLNKIPQQQYFGWQTFYKSGNEQGKKLSESIQVSLNESIEKENKRVAKTIDNVYITTATNNAIIVANLSIIIPFKAKYIKYEHIPIIAVAITGLITNFENVKSSFIFFLRAVIAIVKATA